MSFLDNIINDIQSTNDGTWQKKLEKRKEPPKSDEKEEESWDQALQRYEKKRKIERQQKQIIEKKNKVKQTSNHEILVEMSKMFNRPPPRKPTRINLGNNPFIDTVSKCKVAIDELSKYNIIAVDCEWAGPRDVPRSQELCLVQIADTKNKAYIFDICVGGKDLFDKGGLKGLLEDAKVLKIFHDCRWDSDVLWHQMGVRIENVFDTQIGYACYRRQQESMTPLPVGLKNLLKRFAMGGTHTTKDEAREDMELQQDYWKTRPLTETMLQYAREDVLLLPLVYRQINAIFSPSSRSIAAKNSAVYASQRRDKTLEELHQLQERENANTVESGSFVPTYGIPDWDLAAKVSLDRMRRKKK